MPHFRIETNIPNDRIPKDFLTSTTKLIAKTLGKPENYCVVTIVGDMSMAWGGNTDPCAVGTLMSIGCLGVAENKKHSSVLFEHIKNKLGIPKDRMYITFNDVSSSNLGYQGTTFHEIFGGS